MFRKLNNFVKKTIDKYKKRTLVVVLCENGSLNYISHNKSEAEMVLEIISNLKKEHGTIRDVKVFYGGKEVESYIGMRNRS